VATTISVLSQKGGTGKTTLVRTLTDVFERLGVDVLAVDADPQGNLSDYFDTDPDAEPTLAEVLTARTRAADAIHGAVIPANLKLAEAELALAGKIGREVTLRSALRDLKREKEMILIDCPPTLGLLTVNALVASDHALLSTQTQYFSLQGVEQAMEVVELARESLNPDLELLGVVLNIANMRTKHARQTLEALRARFGDKVFRSVIRQSIAYAESAERAIPILDYRPDRGQDYLSLAGEILRRLGSPELLEDLDALSVEIVPAGARA
jgi:chromosome partitioning protein